MARKKKEVVHTEINSKNIVAESNQLIRMPYRLDLNEQKLVLALASKIHPNDSDFKYYSFKITELADLFGIAHSGAYSEIRKIIEGILKKPIKIKKCNRVGKEVELIINWFASAEYIEAEGRVELEFSQKMKPYFLELKEKYTSFRLTFAVKMKSSYSIRIYTLCQEILKRKYEAEEMMAVEQLKYMLDIEDKYSRFNDFKKNVLDQAKKEIENTDIIFDYEAIREGRAVKKILMMVKKKECQDLQELTSSQDIPASRLDAINQLKELGIEDKYIEELIKDKDDEYLIEKIALVKENYGQGKIKSNIAGYAVAAIKNDYKSSSKAALIENINSDKKEQAINEYSELEKKIEEELITEAKEKVSSGEEFIRDPSLKKSLEKFKNKVTSSKNKEENYIQEDLLKDDNSENEIIEITRVITDIKNMIYSLSVDQRVGAYLVQTSQINKLMSKYPQHAALINKLMLEE